MSEQTRDIPWLDAATIERWRTFPHEELAKYAGQYIAFSWDATRIVASGPDRETVEEQVRAAGLDPGRVIHSYVDADAG